MAVLILAMITAALSPAVTAAELKLVDQPALISCNTADAYCAAANLSRLHSAGAAIATAPCPAEARACQREREQRLAAARERYLRFETALRAIGRDPRFTAFSRNGSDTQVHAFMQRALGHLNSPCKLSDEDCAKARVYLLTDLDQAVRVEPSCIAAADSSTCQQRKAERMSKVDALSTATARDLIAKYGWLGSRNWGRATEDGLFLMVQHADGQPQFQREALTVLKQAAAKGDALPAHAAYLEDRVRVHSSLPQLYGTQGRCLTSGLSVSWEPDPIEDFPNLDQRRRSAGLGLLEEYRQQVTEACRSM